ncbi:MAG: hypothetical protein ACK4PR_10925 [Gammaproteobacteria bacterium]
MKTIFRYKRITWLMTMSLIALIAITAAFLLPPIYHNQIALVHVKSWLDNSQLIFLCWRLAILSLIFVSWPWVIKYKAKRYNWPAANTQKVVHMRYYLMVFLLLLDALFQLGQS